MCRFTEQLSTGALTSLVVLLVEYWTRRALAKRFRPLTPLGGLHRA